MSIILNSIEIIYILILILLIYILFNIKINKNGYEKDYLNKDSTSVLRGLSVIVIFIHHLVRQFKYTEILKITFINLGFIAVSLFLFVSGYALMTQYNKRKNYLDGFVIKKVLKLFLTFILSDILTTVILNMFFGKHFTINEFLKNLLMFKFADGRQLWFVLIILYFYIVFYFAFKCFKQRMPAVIVCISTILYIIIFAIISKGTHWYNTAICFPIGMFISMHQNEIYNIIIKKYLFNLICSFTIFITFMYIYQVYDIELMQFIIPVVFIWLMITILMKVKFNGSFFKFMDTISFEFYLIHLGILKAFLIPNEFNESIYIILSFIVTIILSKILNVFIKKIYDLRLEKKIGNSKDKE